MASGIDRDFRPIPARLIPEPHQIRSPLIKNRSNTSPLPTAAAKCLAIDQVVFINAGDGTEQELRKWMEEHIGEGSYTGARLEATKRLQHLLELRGGAELEGGQTNIDLFCPVFTAKETEERAAAERDGGVTNDDRMAQLRGARRDHGEGEVLYMRSTYEKVQREAEKRQGPAGEGVGRFLGGAANGTKQPTARQSRPARQIQR
jgi:hypothetical protein